MRKIAILAAIASLLSANVLAETAAPKHDLPEIRAAGQLRHLGIPYANFVTGAGDGLDVDLVKMFCRELGVEYVYVETDWGRTISDVTGLAFTRAGSEVTVTGSRFEKFTTAFAPVKVSTPAPSPVAS